MATTAETAPAIADQQAVPSKRDPRVDVLRGLSLLMIFADHIPNNLTSLVTLHNFAFSDAAEIFVLLAGFSGMLAYGKMIERDGWMAACRRIAQRCAKIYVAQIILVLATFTIVEIWIRFFPFPPTVLKAIVEAPIAGLLHAVFLAALPSYLDILPLYVVLLGLFPLVYLALRISPWLAVGGSCAIWVLGALRPDINLPNWVDHKGWYFDPLSWQFLFTLGAMTAWLVSRQGGNLRYHRWLAIACGAYLLFGAIETVPWTDWHLPDIRFVVLQPMDKSHLAWPRIVSVLALTYLVMCSSRLREMAGSALMRPVELCGRHSLEVFAVGCLCALFGRLAYRSFGPGLALQIGVNAIGISAMFLAARYLERGRKPPQAGGVFGGHAGWWSRAMGH